MAIQITETPCCAIAIIHGIGNNTDKSEIAQVLEEKRKETEQKWTPEESGGQTCLIATLSPSEGVLKENLLELGFKEEFQTPRRNGYEPGQIDVLTYHFNQTEQ